MNLQKIKENFKNDGYIHLKNFFDEDEIKLFYNAFEKSRYIKQINSSPEITAINELLFLFENKKLIEILNNISDKELVYFGEGSIIGNVNTNRITWREMHTDTRGNKDNPNGRTYYDPSSKKWPILNLFIYLEDFEKYSGCLKVVKGSHKKFLPTIGNFLKVFFNIAKHYKFDGKYKFKSIPFNYLWKIRNIKTKPGDLFIFNHALHHSPNSLLIKRFENIVLPVFLENLLEKYLPKIFHQYTDKRRMISLCFGEESSELDYFIRSRVQYLNKDYLQGSKFFENHSFREYLKTQNIKSNTTLKKLVMNKEN